MLKLRKNVCLGFEISCQKCYTFRLCLRKGLIQIVTHMGRALLVDTTLMKLLAGLAINSILCAISQYGQRLCAAKLALSLIMPSTPPIHPILTINVSHWPLLTRILQRGRSSRNEEMTMQQKVWNVFRGITFYATHEDCFPHAHP